MSAPTPMGAWFLAFATPRRGQARTTSESPRVGEDAFPDVDGASPDNVDDDLQLRPSPGVMASATTDTDRWTRVLNRLWFSSPDRRQEEHRVEDEAAEIDAPGSRNLDEDERLRARYDFMMAKKTHLTEEEERSRFLHEVSLSFGADYRCPCELNGGTDCMTNCYGRDRDYIRSQRRKTFTLPRYSSDRVEWLASRIESGVKFNDDGSLERQAAEFGSATTKTQTVLFYIHAVQVCRWAFFNILGATPSLLDRAIALLKEQRGVCARPSKRLKTAGQAPGSSSGQNEDKAAAATAWLIAFAKRGNADDDPTPDDRRGDGESHRILRLHERQKSEVYRLYVADLDLLDRAAYSITAFLRNWRKNVTYVKIAAAKSNFSVCTQCENRKANARNPDLSEAERKCNREDWSAHLDDQRDQRQQFVNLEIQALLPENDLMTILHDKESTHSTTLPIWNVKQNNSKSRLKLSNFGAIVTPNVGTVFLCAMPYLLSGSNMVIETLARTLRFAFQRHRAAGSEPPTRCYMLLDNASDNKSKLVLAYACALVYFGTFRTVAICFLLRGHTHNAIDQKFAVLKKKRRSDGARAYCWPRFKELGEAAWNDAGKKPALFDLVTSCMNWDAWLSSFVDNLFARHQMDGNSGEDIHVFRFQIIGNERYPRLFYKFRNGDSHPWYPRPFQIGAALNEKIIMDLQWRARSITKNTTPQDEGVWVISFDGDDETTEERPSPGIVLMDSFPAIALLEAGDDHSDWTATLKAIASNVHGLMNTDSWRQRQCQGSCAWWKSFFESETARTTTKRPCDLRPEEYFPRTNLRTTVPQSFPAPVPPRPPRRADPAVDTIIHSGFTRSQRDRALKDKEVLDERSDSSYKTLRGGAWCMVRFEISETAQAILEAGGDDEEEDDIEADVGEEEFQKARNELVGLGGYCAPVCLARLPKVVPTNTDSAATEIEVMWLKPHNNCYSGNWSRWMLGARSGSRRTIWKSTITRRNIIRTLEDMTFTPTTTTAQDKKKLDKASLDALRKVPETKFEDFK